MSRRVAIGGAARLNAVMGDPHILMKIETVSPIELGDFVSLFASIGSQFEKFIASEHPGQRGEARFYVKEVRAGSIEAELIAWVAGGAGALIVGAVPILDQLNTLSDFVQNYGGRLSRYFRRGGRDPSAGKGDLADFYKTVTAVASDPKASLTLSAAVYEDRTRKVRTAFQFDTSQAREAERQIEEHRKEIEHTSAADHQRVLMTFVRTTITSAKAGKRSGEMVKIEAVHPKALPVVYASELAEQRVRHEIADADENVYKKGFDVDVNVEIRSGRPVAFRVTQVHAVFDLPDEE